MNKTVVINVVGLTEHHIGKHTPFISNWLNEQPSATIKPVLPAVTCSAQYTYLTGKLPTDHGIVGNGWLFRDQGEIKFWRQSNKLVQARKIWQELRSLDSSFTCANMFWWYNMCTDVDYSVTPRPMYPADGRKIPDVYASPGTLRDELQQELGQFPLFNFWGPKTSVKASQWIADASLIVDEQFDPTLSLIYLPHMDYNLQRHGTNHPSVHTDLAQIDEIVKDLATHYDAKNARVILLSGYGITDVEQPVHLNRVFRRKGYISVREELGRELLDPCASKAFAVADHQIAHVYVNDNHIKDDVEAILRDTPGCELVLDKTGKKKYGIDHERAGDFVVMADATSWFTYYYWLDDAKAPDFARTVDIHRKPGYDPVELFVDPEIVFPMGKAAWILLKKKLGFRYLMDLIPLDAGLVKGSHGRLTEDPAFHPVFITNTPDTLPSDSLEPVEIYDIIKKTVLE